VEPGSLSPCNWAPHLSDPDPPQEPMTDEELKEMFRKIGELMLAKGMLKKDEP
jgi:hypothetical protein